MATTAKLPAQPLARLTGHTGPINALTYSAGAGQYILAGSSDRTINLYNPSKASSSSLTTTGNSITSHSNNTTTTTVAAKDASHAGLIQRYTGVHAHEVLTLAVSTDNARFVSAGGDRSVFLWDVATARTLRRFGGGASGGHMGKVECVEFGGEGDSVVCSGGFDASVRMWDTKQGGGGAAASGGGGGGRPIMVLGEAGDSVSCLSVEGPEVWAGSVDGRLRGYDLRMGTCSVDVVGDPLTSLTPTTDLQTHLVSTPTSTLLLLDAPTGKLLNRYSHPSFVNTTYRIRSTLSAPDNKIVLSGSEDGWVCAWDVLTGGLCGRVRHLREDGGGRVNGGVGVSGSRKVVGCVAWRRGRSEWASAGGDGTVVVWGVDGAGA